jgi:hypothetical protein
MGEVQSGKTTTMMALAACVFDLGITVPFAFARVVSKSAKRTRLVCVQTVVVASGDKESLRCQTQYRFQEYFPDGTTNLVWITRSDRCAFASYLACFSDTLSCGAGMGKGATSRTHGKTSYSRSFGG